MKNGLEDVKRGRLDSQIPIRVPNTPNTSRTTFHLGYIHTMHKQLPVVILFILFTLISTAATPLPNFLQRLVMALEAPPTPPPMLNLRHVVDIDLSEMLAVNQHHNPDADLPYGIQVHYLNGSDEWFTYKDEYLRDVDSIMLKGRCFQPELISTDQPAFLGEHFMVMLNGIVRWSSVDFILTQYYPKDERPWSIEFRFVKDVPIRNVFIGYKLESERDDVLRALKSMIKPPSPENSFTDRALATLCAAREDIDNPASPGFCVALTRAMKHMYGVTVGCEKLPKLESNQAGVENEEHPAYTAHKKEGKCTPETCGYGYQHGLLASPKPAISE